MKNNEVFTNFAKCRNNTSDFTYFEYSASLVVAIIVLARLEHSEGNTIKEDHCHSQSFKPSKENKWLVVSEQQHCSTLLLVHYRVFIYQKSFSDTTIFFEHIKQSKIKTPCWLVATQCGNYEIFLSYSLNKNSVKSTSFYW